ncbi:uncharacterized protein LOC128873447 [Hylaeus volcanicus]|uniref:uncharacterized protein LOC128873447 n=1 Tax=Hylaeus volcanicus TaxID=313075 RepID=UPI0023B80A5A|nr:uncharacterized protein LOC128873447 [Hylaeus volcanicus]
MEEVQEPEHPNNVLLFRLAISNNFKRIAESVSKEEFLDILTILKSKPKIVQKLHKALIKELYDSMTGDLEDILKEGSLQESLKKVAILSDESCSIHEDAWRPPGNVTLHLRSLDAEEIKKESKRLSKRVNEIEEENACLMKQITERRSRIFSLHDSITRSLSKTPITIDLLEKRLEQLEKCVKLLDHE